MCWRPTGVKPNWYMEIANVSLSYRLRKLAIQLWMDVSTSCIELWEAVSIIDWNKISPRHSFRVFSSHLDALLLWNLATGGAIRRYLWFWSHLSHSLVHTWDKDSWMWISYRLPQVAGVKWWRMGRIRAPNLTSLQMLFPSNGFLISKLSALYW